VGIAALAHLKYCPDSVRERVVLIEPAREDVVIGFNPLLHDSPQHGYYKVHGPRTSFCARGKA